MTRDTQFNLAALAVAALLGAGITLIVSVMTSEPATPQVSCTPANGCQPTGPRPSHQQMDPLTPPPPSRRGAVDDR